MNEEMLEQFKLVVDSVGQMIQDSEARMKQTMKQMIEDSEERMTQKIEDSEERMTQKIKDSEHNMRLYMELNLEKRIDALFDGYQMAHESQTEIKDKNQQIEQRVDSLETRVLALEKQQSA